MAVNKLKILNAYTLIKKAIPTNISIKLHLLKFKMNVIINIIAVNTTQIINVVEHDWFTYGIIDVFISKTSGKGFSRIRFLVCEKSYNSW